MHTNVIAENVEVTVYPGYPIKPVEKQVLRVLGVREVVDNGADGVEFKLVPGRIPVAEVPVTLDIGRCGRFTFSMERYVDLEMTNVDGISVRIQARGRTDN